MEPEPPKMEARPPALIDAAVRLLSPPACCEHVLGDLWERYASPRRYLLDAMRTVPQTSRDAAMDAALYRSLAHTAHRVGQIVYLAKSIRGEAWQTLSIPKGQSKAFNARMGRASNSARG